MLIYFRGDARRQPEKMRRRSTRIAHAMSVILASLARICVSKQIYLLGAIHLQWQQRRSSVVALVAAGNFFNAPKWGAAVSENSFDMWQRQFSRLVFHLQPRSDYWEMNCRCAWASNAPIWRVLHAANLGTYISNCCVQISCLIYRFSLLCHG